MAATTFPPRCVCPAAPSIFECDMLCSRSNQLNRLNSDQEYECPLTTFRLPTFRLLTLVWPLYAGGAPQQHTLGGMGCVQLYQQRHRSWMPQHWAQSVASCRFRDVCADLTSGCGQSCRVPNLHFAHRYVSPCVSLEMPRYRSLFCSPLLSVIRASARALSLSRSRMSHTHHRKHARTTRTHAYN